MKYRKLRIAWSVAWGIVAGLLVVLWVRSYNFRDRAVVPLTRVRCLRVDSTHGGVHFETYGPAMGEWEASLSSVSQEELSARRIPTLPGYVPQDSKQWSWRHTHTGRFYVNGPHWFFALLCVTLLAAP